MLPAPNLDDRTFQDLALERLELAAAQTLDMGREVAS